MLPAELGSIDFINDFNPLEDSLALSGNLSFEDLTFEQGTGLSFRDTLITIDNGRLLAILVNVPASIISEEDFVDVGQLLPDVDFNNTNEVL